MLDAQKDLLTQKGGFEAQWKQRIAEAKGEADALNAKWHQEKALAQQTTPEQNKVAKPLTSCPHPLGTLRGLVSEANGAMASAKRENDQRFQRFEEAKKQRDVLGEEGFARSLSKTDLEYLFAED